jgi:hypothetical protein
MIHPHICIVDTCNCRLAFWIIRNPIRPLECDYFRLHFGFRELQTIFNFHLAMENTAGTVHKVAYVGLRSCTSWIA